MDKKANMSSLPSELIHMTCKLLPVDSIPSFRLVHPVWADVGLHYMIPEVHLVLLPSSFARLQAIAEHPVLRQYVSSLIYEANTLPKFENFAEWRLPAIGNIKLPRKPPQGASERDIRAYNRALDKAYPEEFPRAEAMKAWKAYRKLYKGQEALRRSGEDVMIIQEAIARFPRLSNVGVLIMAPPRCSCECHHISSHGQNAYASGLVHPAEVWNNNLYNGIRATKTLLTGAALGTTKLTTLELRNIGWGFSDPDFFAFDQFQGTLISIRELKPSFPVEGYEDWQYTTLQERLPSFINLCATSLESLSIWFEEVDDEWVELTHMFKECTLPCLKSLTVSEFQVQTAILQDFFARHAETLKQLFFRCSVLLGGQWSDLFTQIPVILDLEEVKLRGVLVNMEDGTFINMDRLSFDPAGGLFPDQTLRGRLPVGSSLRDQLEALLCRRTHGKPGDAELLKELVDHIDSYY